MKQAQVATQKTTAQKIGDFIVNTLLVLSFVVLIISCYLVYTYKDNPDEAYLFGFKPVYVLTGSMEPTLREHSVCIVQKTTYDDVKVDDMIMYTIDDKTITHRIIEKTELGIRTKGDNNNVEDAYLLQPENINAKVVLRLNIVADIVNDCSAGWQGYFKWIALPILIIMIPVITIKVIKKIMTMPDDDEEKPNNIENKTQKTPEVEQKTGNVAQETNKE